VKHIVKLSGGLASWAAAERVFAQQDRRDITLLFTDTMMEDQDLYRFLNDIEADWRHPIVRLADGRNPWEVFRDKRFLGNTRIDPCSRILKRELADRWLAENCEPDNTIVYLGYDFTEEDRLARSKAAFGARGWRVESPLMGVPRITRKDMAAALAAKGIKLPRLYGMGFEHNNCGGFCVKAGQRQFAHLLRTMPERYAWHEAWEDHVRGLLGDVSILRDRTGGTTKPLTMKAFRQRLQGGEQEDTLDTGSGACSCFTPSAFDVDEMLS
jgi:3'-phosphoadenosine 5'-phosphosulfate sulfotransferase (PAPS reductase)/FAD synthetase